MGVLEKIEEIEKEMSRTQKNKATEYHLGQLKAKLAKYRAQLLEPEKKGAKGEGFDVLKSGDARVCLIGFPSVGKSTLLSKTTKTESVTGAYEFTTLTAIPGVLEYEGARIQLLDLPGIVQDAAKGRGRGRQVVAVAKTADLIILMIDATKSAEQKRQLETELEAVGIRLNARRPDVVFKPKSAGGVTVTITVKLTKTDERTIKSILQTYRIHNCDVVVREDITTDEFIDVLLGTRQYIPALTVINKIDGVSMETLDKMAREGDGKTVMISCEMDLGLDWLLERIWQELGLVKVYTKKRGEIPDLSDPICLRQGATIETVCHGIHRSLASQFKYALVWGKSSKFNPQPQKVGLTHLVQDEDVVSIITK
ncbi:putative GTP-binding protein [Kockovaella imperatae]|uniref:Putative GTP-binding protein n=1 Tax=Kockovaella imperatae TaxID=4999 RepID=A0A1Y1ULT7_9TREE|nr:putative GTP-binding protein [Kockovaella imperatae]ORX39011.1 putative GTP-binding protein [Kockovaella imperatae]